MKKPLDASSDNTLVWRLGDVARVAGDPTRRDVGDPIDRGLILLRLLREAGFYVYEAGKEPTREVREGTA